MPGSTELQKCGGGPAATLDPHTGSRRAAAETKPRASADGDPAVDRLWNALREVMDPEIPISLVDLGLIYDIRLHDGTVEVDLTYTATACPCTTFIKWDIAERLHLEDEVADIRINEVWNPPWTKARISQEGRRKLAELGVSL